MYIIMLPSKMAVPNKQATQGRYCPFLLLAWRKSHKKRHTMYSAYVQSFWICTLIQGKDLIWGCILDSSLLSMRACLHTLLGKKRTSQLLIAQWSTSFLCVVFIACSGIAWSWNTGRQCHVRLCTWSPSYVSSPTPCWQYEMTGKEKRVTNKWNVHETIAKL